MTRPVALSVATLTALVGCQPAGEFSTPASEVGETTPAASETVEAKPRTIPRIGTCIGCDADSLIAHYGLRESDAPVRDRSDWSPPRRALVVPDPLLVAALEAADLDIELLVPQGLGEAVRMAGQADVIVGWPCARQLVQAATAVKFWQYGSAGVEPCAGNATFRERAPLLSNAQRLYGPQLAEHAIALMLMLTRQLHRYGDAQREGRWIPREPAVVELDGKTMLIVGLGGTGHETARRAHALGMRVIATRRSSRDGPDYVDYVGLSDEYVELAREADVVVNAAPLTPETAGMFDAAFFEAMKPTGYFINVARGGSVNTDDLVAALVAGQLAGAGLDVTDPEPLPSGHPLWSMEDVIITPHAAGGSDLARDRWRTLAVENLRRYIAGEQLLSLVNIEAGY